MKNIKKVKRAPRRIKKKLKNSILKSISSEWRQKDLICKSFGIDRKTKKIKITHYTLG